MVNHNSQVISSNLLLNWNSGVSLKEIRGILTEKRKDDEENMQTLLDFLHGLRKQKHDEIDELQEKVDYITKDIHALERRRRELTLTRVRCSPKPGSLAKIFFVATQSLSMLTEKYKSASLLGAGRMQSRMNSDNPPNEKSYAKDQRSSREHQRNDALCSAVNSHVTPSGQTNARKRRIHSRFKALENCYLEKRQEWDTSNVDGDNYRAGLEEFQSILAAATQYSGLRVIAELDLGDPSLSTDIVTSVEFDRDDEYFATAGTSRNIKIFEFSSVVNEPTEVHCPISEFSTGSKLSCLTWNKYTQSQIASAEYDGTVTLWDASIRQSLMKYQEHSKRAWSIDFSHTEPSMLVSGGDDGKVKVWCTKQEQSVLNIDMKANVCSVKYNPTAGSYIAVGSADHQIYYYDLRNTNQPLNVFGGSKKAVSYVNFLSSNELASASIDSKLRLWDVEKTSPPLRTFRGHTNKKNFVGLSANSQYIACGSETNEVFVYHKALSTPLARYKFGSSHSKNEKGGSQPPFVSAVCWKRDSPTIMLAGNSQGEVKVLELTA